MNSNDRPYWRKNWASRGTALLPYEKSGASRIQKNHVPLKKKLELLMKRYPYNDFFKSLAAWPREYSRKQIEAIEKRYSQMSAEHQRP